MKKDLVQIVHLKQVESCKLEVQGTRDFIFKYLKSITR